MNKKLYEVFLVFIIIGVVVIVSSEYINKIAEKSMKNRAQAQTLTLMTTIEQLYTEAKIKGEDELPFIVVFQDGEMYLKTGSPAKIHVYEGAIKFSGQLPKSGEITLLSDGRVIVSDIKVGNYVCNTLKENEVICEKA